MTRELQSECEALRAVEVGWCSGRNDCVVSTDGRAGGCLKGIIPEHSAISSLQPLVTVT